VNAALNRQRQLRILSSRLGRIIRSIRRKVEGKPALEEAFALAAVVCLDLALCGLMPLMNPDRARSVRREVRQIEISCGRNLARRPLA
jgi:hypothetical protein